MGGSKAGAGRAANSQWTCSLPVCRWLTKWEAGGGTTLLPNPPRPQHSVKWGWTEPSPIEALYFILLRPGEISYHDCPERLVRKGPAPASNLVHHLKQNMTLSQSHWVPPLPPFLKESRKANTVAHQVPSTLVLELRALAWPYLALSDPRSCSCDCRTMTTLE